MEKSKKIVMVINDLQAGGAERVVINLYDEFAKLGHQPTIIYFKKNTLLNSNDRHTLNLVMPKWLGVFPKSLKNKIFCKIFDKFVVENIGHPDLVLSNLTSSDRVLCHSQLDNVYLVIHTLMSSAAKIENLEDRNRLRGKLLSTYIKKPVITVSDGSKNDFISLFPEVKNIRRIYNGVNIEQIETDSLEFTPNISDYFIHIGRFKQVKRHDLLIEAYSKSGANKALCLMGDGPLMDRCRDQVVRNNIEPKVIFLGVHGNPFPYIKAASALIVSSDYEGLPMVILEALALGVPVISTDCPTGPREILPSMNLVPVNDSVALAKLIKNVCGSPLTYRLELLEKFTVQHAAKEYLSLCRR